MLQKSWGFNICHIFAQFQITNHISCACAQETWFEKNISTQSNFRFQYFQCFFLAKLTNNNCNFIRLIICLGQLEYLLTSTLFLTCCHFPLLIPSCFVHFLLCATNKVVAVNKRSVQPTTFPYSAPPKLIVSGSAANNHITVMISRAPRTIIRREM